MAHRVIGDDGVGERDGIQHPDGGISVGGRPRHRIDEGFQAVVGIVGGVIVADRLLSN